MHKYAAALAGVVGFVALAGSMQAASLSEMFSSCVEKYANHKQTVTVMLQCTAADGKLTNCSVVDAPSPTNGFDKAAMCVADVLPIGSKTGQIKVPILFQATN